MSAYADVGKPNWMRAYSFVIWTGLLFVGSWLGQFVFQLIQHKNEAAQHGNDFSMVEFWPAFLSSTLENWQSEFLQLAWQTIGLAIFLCWGSSQSKESDERVEAKIDALLVSRGIDPEDISRDINKSA